MVWGEQNQKSRRSRGRGKVDAPIKEMEGGTKYNNYRWVVTGTGGVKGNKSSEQLQKENLQSVGELRRCKGCGEAEKGFIGEKKHVQKLESLETEKRKPVWQEKKRQTIRKVLKWTRGEKEQKGHPQEKDECGF